MSTEISPIPSRSNTLKIRVAWLFFLLLYVRLYWELSRPKGIEPPPWTCKNKEEGRVEGDWLFLAWVAQGNKNTKAVEFWGGGAVKNVSLHEIVWNCLIKITCQNFQVFLVLWKMLNKNWKLNLIKFQKQGFYSYLCKSQSPYIQLYEFDVVLQQIIKTVSLIF